MFPKRKKKSLYQTLKKHETHHKKHFIGGGTGEQYLLLMCACGELIVYDKLRVLDGDPFNSTTYNNGGSTNADELERGI
jgi:hypothetical protein